MTSSTMYRVMSGWGKARREAKRMRRRPAAAFRQ
jgi:hypothetical protein